MRPALKRNDKALSQLSFGTKKCIWPKGGLRNTFYLFILYGTWSVSQGRRGPSNGVPKMNLFKAGGHSF